MPESVETFLETSIFDRTAIIRVKIAPNTSMASAKMSQSRDLCRHSVYKSNGRRLQRDVTGLQSDDVDYNFCGNPAWFSYCRMEKDNSEKLQSSPFPRLEDRSLNIRLPTLQASASLQRGWLGRIPTFLTFQWLRHCCKQTSTKPSK